MQAPSLQLVTSSAHPSLGTTCTTTNTGGIVATTTATSTPGGVAMVVPRPLPAPPAISVVIAAPANALCRGPTRISIPDASPSSAANSLSATTIATTSTSATTSAMSSMHDMKHQKDPELLVPVVTPTEDDTYDLAVFEGELLAVLDENALQQQEPSWRTTSTTTVSDIEDPAVSDDSEPMSVSTTSTVSQGQEKTGRWTQEEHKVFLKGLEQHGKQWKLIAAMIGTRTIVQVRTHAQKYFQKMQRDGSKATMSFSAASKQQHGRQAAATTEAEIPLSLETATTTKNYTKTRNNKAGNKDSPKKKHCTIKKKASPRKLRITLNNKMQPTTFPTGAEANGAYSSVPNPFLELTSHPSYVSSTGSSGTDTEPSVETWCGMDVDTLMISPNTVTVDLVDVDQHLKLPAAPFLASQEQQQQQQSSLDELAAFEGDPLEWLIENEVGENDDGQTNSWLPESSLPYFPELVKGKLAASSEISLPVVAPEPVLGNHHEHPGAVIVPHQSTASDSMVEEAITKNMVDPNVTVHSLFLPGETNPLV